MKLAKPEKQKKKKKFALKKFLVSYDVFAIFITVKHSKIPKNTTERYNHF